MTWVLVIGLALAVFAALALLFRLPRGGWEVIGAALLLGLAGYSLQGAPGLPGAPKAPAEKIAGNSAAAIAERQKLAAGDASGDKRIIIADALARHGQFADAAEVLRGAVEEDPANAPAWLAMANALVAHADGTISPAAIHAFGQAAKAEPGSPGPPFFLGMALIQSGRLGEGRAIWADLLARSPAQAPWRADLEQRLAELDAYMARGQAAPGPAQ
ncbi:tetratricopeptide repeat protein [Novosphingobium bradum]|uniref:Tetratricopeptide repeat protein n=1 Tax=Novosphingobium bradum TaxID=1737444 RepID=A0ABV7IW32_9SPHN